MTLPEPVIAFTGIAGVPPALSAKREPARRPIICAPTARCGRDARDPSKRDDRLRQWEWFSGNPSCRIPRVNIYLTPHRQDPPKRDDDERKRSIPETV
ncbi:MAG TPA: hypothetical protein VIT88_11505 [Pyrinomonadaceae bacterium]